LKFAHSYPDRLVKISSLAEIHYAVMDKNNHVPAVYIDVSESKDDGQKIWEELSHESWAQSVPVIAICQESNLTQVRNAILSNVISDLIFEPIDVESIKRRIKKYQTHDDIS
jgi:response regulator RpfG family c-di-GMP phosphodiesterase